MRLAIFLQAPEVWGAERSLLTLLASEAALHHEIDVFVRPGSPLARELSKVQVTTREFDFLRHKSLTDGGLRKASPFTILTDLRSIWAQALRSRKLLARYDVVLTFGLWETAEIALAGRMAGTPVIFDFHVTFSGRIGRAALRGISWLANGVIAPSLATYSQAGITPKSRRLRVVPRPVTGLHHGKDAALSNKKLRVGIFGQVDDRKGVLEVVTTLSPLADLVTLLVVGARHESSRTAYEKEIINLVQQTGHDWEVLERTDDVGALMATCDVVLNMSRHEAFGRTVVEAASVGALPLVMAGGGPEEVVNDMKHGLVVSSWSELSTVINSLSAKFQRGESVRLSPEQIQAVAERYSPTAIGKQYFEQLELLSSAAQRTLS
jgi:glycosyltransferase involved in cell wall biosynthesis